MIEIGIDSEVLKNIRDGRKTVEGRLARDKFLDIKSGDVISVREDFYVDGAISSCKEDSLRIKVVAVEMFDDFRSMLQAIGFKKAVPYAKTLDEAYIEYLRFYSEASQKEHGVLGISFQVVSS